MYNFEKLKFKLVQYAVVKNENARTSSIGFDDHSLLISLQSLHPDFESLAHHTASFQKSGTNGYAAIPFEQITAIQYHLNHPEFYVQYRKSGNPKLIKYYLGIASNEVRDKFCSALAKASGLNSKKEFESPFARIWEYLLFIFFTILFTFSVNYLAKGGLAYHRRAVVHLVAELVKITGTIVPTILGGLLCCYFVYKIIYNFFHPTKTILYT